MDLKYESRKLIILSLMFINSVIGMMNIINKVIPIVCLTILLILLWVNSEEQINYLERKKKQQSLEYY